MKLTKKNSLSISLLLHNREEAEELCLFSLTHVTSPLLMKPESACAQCCVCICWCLSLGLQKRFLIHMLHYDPSPHPSISVSFPPLLKSLSSLTPSSTKHQFTVTANQSLHSCSQLSMTRFIWLGPCRPHQLSSFSVLLVGKGR